MANTYNSLSELFTAIANAIRTKKQSAGVIVADDFPEEIEGIETPNLQSKTVTPIAEEQIVTPDAGYNGLSQVTVEAAEIGGGNSPEAELALTLWSERSKATALDYMFDGCSSLTTVPLFDTSKVTSMTYMFRYCSSLTTVPLFDTSKVTDMRYMFDGCGKLTTVPLFDTSKVTSMTYMFDGCISLTTVPLFDTSKVTSMAYMFYGCGKLTTVPLFDTSKVTNMADTFGLCESLTTAPLFDTSKVTNMYCMFFKCISLTTVPLFDCRNASNLSTMFAYCSSLTDCYLRNIKTNLQVGSGTTYGHLLTLDSLIHLIKECRDTGSQKTLTVGSANLEKLANVYVRTIDITDEMRTEDDLIDEKYPFEVCESTDEGAMLIVDYANAKHWAIA